MTLNSDTSKNYNKSQIAIDNKAEKIETEKINSSVWLERKTFRIALIGTFTALAIVLGYLLAYVPNIELFTLMIFLSGFILGKRDGIIIGLFSSFIFCFFNPISPSPLPLLMFQLFHYSLTGLLGGISSDYMGKKEWLEHNADLYIFPVMAFFGLLGALITINFQIFASLVSVLSIYGSLDQLLPYFLTGIIFTVIHIIGNTLGFIFILPELIQLIKKMVY